MKIARNKNNNKKLTIILIIVMLFNMAFPKPSNAMVTSILSKPIATLVVKVLDAVNAALATLVATDTKVSGIWNDVKDTVGGTVTTLKDKGSEGLFNTIVDGLDDLTTAIYNFLLSPEDIFSGKVQITNANIFSSTYDKNGMVDGTDWNLFNHLMKQVKRTAAGLYYSMRNIAAVILLCLFVYCGIRIVLASTNAGEKAKWKEYLYDWLKALALLMTVHIIMIGIFFILDAVTDGINSMMSGGESIVTQIRKNFDRTSVFDGTGVWIYTILYGYVTYMSIVFLIAYFKRLFFITVMIIIAPIVSVLYGLGKTTKSIFTRWFKEFTMGLMIQPFHLIIYGILIGIPMTVLSGSGINIKIGTDKFTAWQFTTIDAQIYALIAISMIRPIEKAMRKILGMGETILDNVASFESGKKTLDAAIKVGVETVKTVGTVAAIAATGGAAAAAAPAALGGAAGGAGAASAGGTAAASAAGGMPPVPGGGLPISGAEGGLPTPDLSVGEGQDIQNEMFDGFSRDPFHDDYFAGDQFYDNNLQNSQGPNPPMNEEELQNWLDGMGLEGEERAEMENELREFGHGNQNDDSNGEAQPENDSSGEAQSGDELTGTEMGSTLREQLRDAMNAIRSNSTVQGLTSPESLEQFENLRKALHGLTDSFYIDNAPGDWQFTGTLLMEHAKKKREEMLVNFTNDPKNIDKAVELYGLQDKKDQYGNVVTAQEQAKEKLKGMEPYVSRGITDVGKIAELQKMGMTPEQAVKTYAATTAKVNNFTTNQNNIQAMNNIVADRMGIPSERRSDPQVIQQINQEVSQVFRDGGKYISSGAAKDSETLHRLVELERKITSIGVSGGGSPRADYVVKADRIIQKAVQDEIKKAGSFKGIKVPGGSVSNKAVKKLEDALTAAAQEQIDRLNSDPIKPGPSGKKTTTPEG